MTEPDFAPLVGPALAAALVQRGFDRLTLVQEAVLDEALAGRDLRLTSQTGSGKTVALGFALRHLVTEPAPPQAGVAHPRALVVVPTRELAKQVEEELTWLYAKVPAKVASAAGGASARDERRAFSAGPVVVVGTPGRLLDHLRRGSVDASAVEAVVLDEADRMLDLGFREDLEAILSHAPEGHLTHLVSATFPREVKTLADQVQNDPAHVEGTPLGTANADIDHVVHLVGQRDRLAAIINLLLAAPDGQTLVFVRTRADVAELTSLLGEAGFKVRALSGEMEQADRNKALVAFKKGSLNALIATDVAARGLDVQDIGTVIHAEPPTDADSYTHRSGRTGRAGRKGISAVLVSPEGLAKTAHLLRRAGVAYKLKPVPTAAAIRAEADDRLIASLSAEEADGPPPDERMVALAARLVALGDPARALARLLSRAGLAGVAEPREVAVLEPPRALGRPPLRAPSGRPYPQTSSYPPPPPRSPEVSRMTRGVHPASREPSTPPPGRPLTPNAARSHARAPSSDGEGWVPFRVTWGEEQGADARRLLAMVCRRGGIRGSDVGSIQVDRRDAVVEVSRTVAPAFAAAAGAPDPRDPRVLIHPLDDGPPREERPVPAHAPPPRSFPAPQRAVAAVKERVERDKPELAPKPRPRLRTTDVKPRSGEARPKRPKAH